MSNEINTAKIEYVEYDMDTGYIFGYGISHGAPGHMSNAPGKLLVDMKPESTTHWVSGSVLTSRPISPVIREGLMLKNIKPGSAVKIDGTTYNDMSGNVTLDLPLAGKYKVEVVRWPDRDAVFEVIK